MAKVFKQTDRNPIGMVVSSLLTLAQFQAINGTGWVLADGSSVAGSTYASITGNSTIPDLRGMVLRGKNNGRSDGNQNPDGDSALGTYQADAFQTHNHYFHGSSNYGQAAPYGAYGLNGGASSGAVQQPNSGNVASETRMRNITVNHFIKINN